MNQEFRLKKNISKKTYLIEEINLNKLMSQID